MKHTTILYRLSLISCFFIITEHSDSQSLNCSSLKNGVFHYYPQNAADYIISERKDDVQTEVDQVSGDSVNYTVKWLDDCSYSLKYKSSSKLKPAELQILKNNEFIDEITSTTNQYYVYNVRLNSKKNEVILSDTMWLQKKRQAPDNRVFSQATPIELKRSHFADTSQYAVLYVFRPSKIPCLAVDYLLEANGIPMFLSKNNSAGMFKIYKQGPLRLGAKIGTKENKFSFDVAYGKTYYLAAYIKWSLPYCTPDIYLLPDDKGKEQRIEAGF